jgi:hypothetical protein
MPVDLLFPLRKELTAEAPRKRVEKLCELLASVVNTLPQQN